MIKGYEKDLALIYPLSEDHSVLRRSIVPSLLNVAAYNQARKISDLAFFEIGKRYYHIDVLKPENIREEMLVSGYLNGKAANTSWKGNPEVIDFLIKLIDEITTKYKNKSSRRYNRIN